jgi:plasmid stabilization system protein ParE
MVKIVWTEISILDLKEIFDFIAEDSVRYATITTNKIYQSVQMITGNPYLGRIVPEFNEKLIRELIEGNYRIIYRIKSEFQVDILRVYHSARLLKSNKFK